MPNPVLPPSTFQLILWWVVYISPLVNVVIIAITAIILLWYTWETNQLRENAQAQSKNIEKQIEVSQQQVQATNQQIEIMQRPFILIDPVWAKVSTGNFLRTLIVRNIGNGAAVNIELIHGIHRSSIAIIDSKQSVDVKVIEIESSATLERALKLSERIVGTVNPQENNREEEYTYELDTSSIESGVGLKIEYYNVAMIQYYTNQFILSTGVRIDGFGRMSSIPAPVS